MYLPILHINIIVFYLCIKKEYSSIQATGGKNMSFRIISFLILLIGQNLHAAELKVFSGSESGACSISNKVLLEAAQYKAELNAGPRMVRVSKWHEKAFVRFNHYSTDICMSKGAWSQALFISVEDQHSTPDYLTLDFGISNERINWDVPGNNVLSDKEAWEQAVEKNRNYALNFCKTVTLDKILSKSKKIFNHRSWYDFYSVKVRFECGL